MFFCHNNSNFDTLDAFFLVFITTFSFATRFWIIQHPNAVTFDEIYFGNFTNYYITGSYFYDIHPPFSKMLMALFAYISDYDGTIDFEDNFAFEYPSEDYITLRLTPAFFSSLCAPLIYLTIRLSSFSHTAAFVGSLFLILDTSMLTEQRFILSDGMLHFFTCLFLAFYTFTLNHREYAKNNMILTIISGFLLGMPCSTKNTAWGLMAYVAFIEIYESFQQYSINTKEFYFDVISRGLSLFLPLFTVYLSSFLLHIILLPYAGPGIDFLSFKEAKQFFFKERANFSLHARRLSHPSLLKRFFTLIVDMHIGNMDMTEFHPSQSRPLNWPLLTGRWVDFWGDGDSRVECIGNPVIYYIVFISIFITLLYVKNEKYSIAIRNIVGWAVSYFPFYLVPRTMYLYHYIIPLIFGCMNAGITLDYIKNKFIKGFIATFFVAFAFLGFIIYSPFSYGTKSFDIFLITMKRWTDGDEYYEKLAESAGPLGFVRT